jgi:hypothetical protein
LGADDKSELRSIELFVQGKSADESLGEEAAGLMKQITDLLYSTEVRSFFSIRGYHWTDVYGTVLMTIGRL